MHGGPFSGSQAAPSASMGLQMARPASTPQLPYPSQTTSLPSTRLHGSPSFATPKSMHFHVYGSQVAPFSTSQVWPSSSHSAPTPGSDTHLPFSQSRFGSQGRTYEQVSPKPTRLTHTS